MFTFIFNINIYRNTIMDPSFIGAVKAREEEEEMECICVILFIYLFFTP